MLKLLVFQEVSKNLTDLTKRILPKMLLKGKRQSYSLMPKIFSKIITRKLIRKLFVAVMTMYGENIDSKWLVPEYVKFKVSAREILLQRLINYMKNLFLLMRQNLQHL